MKKLRDEMKMAFSISEKCHYCNQENARKERDQAIGFTQEKTICGFYSTRKIQFALLIGVEA